MTCDRMAATLVAYHFGVVEDAARARLEAHLLECRACLADFLALKRDIDLSATTEAVSSAGSRARLRKAVAKEVARKLPRKASSWWETALLFGFAGTAVVCAIAITSQIAISGGSRPRGAVPTVEVGH